MNKRRVLCIHTLRVLLAVGLITSVLLRSFRIETQDNNKATLVSSIYILPRALYSASQSKYEPERILLWLPRGH
jgi:hypothetical protein